MRLGDYVLCINLGLNALACSAYAYQGYYKNAIYWIGVMIINATLIRLS